MSKVKQEWPHIEDLQMLRLEYATMKQRFKAKQQRKTNKDQERDYNKLYLVLGVNGTLNVKSNAVAF